MTKQKWLIAAMSMHKYASKFLKSDNGQVQRRGNACKAFALVYSDRAATGYKCVA